MTKQNTSHSALTRALSFLLALCAIAVLVPQISANAASMPTALRVGTIYSEQEYSSPSLGGTVTIRDIPVAFNDDTTSFGFCYNHGAKLTVHTSGYRWVSDGNPISASSLAAAPFLAFFYDGLTTENWNDWERNLVSSWVQVALWLSQTGAFTDYKDSSQLLKVAKERAAVLETLGMSATVDDAVELMQRIISSYEAGVYGTLTAYVYYYDDAAAYMQPVFVGNVETKSTDYFPAHVKLSKTVEGESEYQADAVFGIYADATCTVERSRFSTTPTQWNTSDEVNLTTPTATLYVKEISSGDPNLAVNPAVFAVEVNSAIHNTAATAATVVGDGADGSIVNRPAPPPPSGGILQKVDAATGGGLPGATFKFEGNAAGGGYVSLNATTDASGIIELQWLDASAPNYIAPGEYTVTEEIPPAGYEKSDEARHLRLWVETVDGNPVARSSGTLIFENFRKHSLTLRKTSDGSLSVAGAVFDLYRNGTKLGSYTTGSGGTITLPIVDSGYYEFVETTAPNGMVLPFNPRVGVYIDATDTSITDHYVSMKNFEYPDIIIQKQSKATGLPLAGAKFQVQIDATTIGTFTTNSTGRITIGYEQYGAFLDGSASSWTVTVTEVSPPDGYFEPDEKTQTNELRKGQTLSPFVYKNQPFPDVLAYKTDAKTAVPLEGAVFSLVGKDNANSFVAVSQADGIARFERVPVGTYELRETVAPEGYLLSGEVKTVVVREDGAAELSFEFANLRKPKLTLTKYDYETAQTLPNAEFSISHKGGAVVHEGITNAAGQIILEGLEPGWYTITELAPPPGYLIMTPSRDVELKPGEDLEVKIDNVKCPTLTLNKVDSITRDGLSGVRFKIEFSATSGFVGAVEDLGEAVTDANGQIVLKHPQYKMAAGWYRLTEIAAKPGYNLANPTSQTLHLAGGENKTMTFENVPKSALIIRKTDLDGKPVQGATFTVRYLGGTSGSGGTVIHTGVTSVNGTIVLTGLAAGTYVVEETKPADGMELSNPSVQTAYISGLDQDVVELAFANPRMGKLVITKLDSVTKQPLAGATFKVTDSSGGVIGSSNGIYTTDASGIITIAEDLPVGSTVIVTEQSAPDGYIMDGTPQTVKIKENTLHSLTFYNAPKSSAQIIKIDSVTKQPLKNAQFTVYKANGERIGTFTTDGNGVIILPELAPGWYKAAESKAPNGYLIDDTPKDFEITSNQFVKLVFENVPIGDVQIIKLDEDTRKPIPNVQFTVAKMNGERVGGTYITDAAGLIRLPELDDGWYTAVEIKAANGYLLDSTPYNFEVVDGKTSVLTITNKKAAGILLHKVDSVTGKGIYGVQFLLSDAGNNPVGQYTSDQDGYVYIGFDEQLPYGKYFLREIRQADGYIRDDEVKTVYLEAGKTSQITWKNTPERGQILMTKRSAQYNEVTGLAAGSLLPGAVFEIYSVTGNLVDRIVSDSRGVAASKLLPTGVYVIKEVSPPKFYALNPREFLAEIRHNGDIVRFEVLNENISLGVTISKKTQAQATPGQMMMYDLFDIANVSTAPLENFYVNDRLPTDAVRGSKVFTGTWSDRLTYRVTYKTNYSSEYKVLASGLSTKNEYGLSIHPNVLGLASGEYVTDIRFEFGTVPAGFKSVVNPKIQVQVLPTLPKGYKIVNRAEVGGKYLNEWETAQASVTTIPSSGYNPPELPKTGW